MNTDQAARHLAAQSDQVDRYLRVLHALMLRDMRTRFLGSYWGYVIQILWPVTHMFLVTAVMVVRNMPSPFGDSIMIFAASGAVPVLAFQYIAREMMKGIVINRPLTYYPQVKAFDVMVSRAAVEIAGSFIGVVIIFFILLSCGADPVPKDIPMAITGYICSLCLGVALGTVNCAIIVFFPGWLLGFVGLNVILYAASGIVFLSTDLPQKVYDIARWNPLFQLVEWVRLGYDPSLPVKIDYVYLFLWVSGLLTLGLFIERNVSRHTS